MQSTQDIQVSTCHHKNESGKNVQDKNPGVHSARKKTPVLWHLTSPSAQPLTTCCSLQYILSSGAGLPSWHAGQQEEKC